MPNPVAGLRRRLTGATDAATRLRADFARRVRWSRSISAASGADARWQLRRAHRSLMPLVVVFNQQRAGSRAGARREPGVPVSVSQIQVRAEAAEDHTGLAVSGQDRAAADGRAGVRLAWWRRLCPSSFALAGVTVIIVWAGVAELLTQGRLETDRAQGRLG